MVMRIRCVCGEEKPHGQICWIRMEIEVPEANNDEHYIEAGALQRSIPICRSCFKRLLNSRMKKKGKVEGKGEKILLDVLRKRIEMGVVDDIETPSAMDCIAQLAFELHNDRSVEELEKVKNDGRVNSYSD